MANRPWFNIPESDYQADNPVPQPVLVEMMYPDPIVKEQTRKDGSGTFTAYYYGIKHEDNEYTLSASEGLNSMIQGVGATQGSIIKILKRRIGPAMKDIRYTVTHEDGPIDQSKIDAGRKPVSPQAQSQGAPVAQTKAPPTPTAGGGEKYYLPLRENETYMALLKEIAVDKATEWQLVYNVVADLFPDENSEWVATRATHLNIDLQKEMYHKWEKDPHIPLPPAEELDERELAVRNYDQSEYPESLFDVIAEGHEGIEDGDAAREIVKKFGYKASSHLPAGDYTVLLQAARICWRYQDRVDQGMEEYYCMVGTADEFDMPYDILDLPERPEDDPEF